MDLPVILCIETSGPTCSVALYKGNELICLIEENESNKHAEKLAIFCKQVLEKNAKLDYVAVSMGPGSYTGLRIGVATAKGICFATGAKLIGISTTRALTTGYVNSFNPNLDTLLCPMIDARRMEVYTATYDSNGHEVMPVRAVILDKHFTKYFEQGKKIVFFGSGAFKMESFKDENIEISIENGLNYSAKWLLDIALQKIEKKQFEDLAYFEPFYLKDFMMTFPKNVIADKS